MKILQIVAGLIALLVVLAIASVAYLALTFDAEAQRTRIIELVKEKTGRELRIDGAFKLTFLPRLGVVLGRVALSEKPTSAASAQAGAKPAPFLQVDSARASLRILPLLTGRFAADRVVLTGLSGEFVRHRDGSTNFDDLVGAKPASSEQAPAQESADSAGAGHATVAIPAIEIAGVEISGASIGWRDERAGTVIRLKDLALQTGRIAAAVPGQITLRAQIEASKPALALRAELLTGYVFDPRTRSLQLSGFTALLSGDAPGFSGLDATFSFLAAEFDGTAQRLDLEMLRLVARDDAGFTATLTMPRLALAPGLVAGEPADLSVQIERPARKLAANIALSAPVMRTGQVTFEKLTGKLLVSGPDLPAAGIALEFSGNAGLDWGKKLGNVQLSAPLYGGTVQARARAEAASGALSANGVLSGIAVGPLLQDLARNNFLSGRGTVRFALSSHGNSVAALRRGLGGTASIALRDGAIKGFNLAQTIRRAQAAVGSAGAAAQPGSSAEQTDFSALVASVVITNGVARNDDLSLKSPLLRVGGSGTVDIGAGSLDYLLKTTIVGTLAGQGGSELANLRGVTIPVRISGAFDKLSYRPDLSGALVAAAKQQLRSRIEEQLGIGKPANGTGAKPAPAKSPVDLIKGLLGR